MQIPNLLDKEIIEASNNEKFIEENFLQINNFSFLNIKAKDSLKNLNKCSSYFKNKRHLILKLLKNVFLTYRLIGTQMTVLLTTNLSIELTQMKVHF